jgi:hypothetical protein
MSKKLLISVIRVAMNHSAANQSELLNAKKIASSVFDAVICNRLVDISFVDASWHALKLIRLVVDGASINDIESKTKEVLLITKSLRYKRCGDNGMIKGWIK